MSTINFPSVPLQEFQLEVQVPNVIRHSSIYTAKEQIFSRGNMFFAGRIGWAARNIVDRQSEVIAIETFLTECYGPVNDFLINLPVDQSERFKNTSDLAISSVTTTKFQSEFTATAGLLVGDWVNIGTRLHRIVYVDTTTYRVVPAITDSDLSKISWVKPRMKARLAQDVVQLQRIGTLSGPYQVQVIEVL